jgi:hypothetical protein
MHHARSLFLLLAVATLARCTTTLRTSESFDQERASIEAIAVMPPEVSYQLRTATLSEMSPETAVEVNAVVQQALENVLAESRFAVAPLVLTDSLLAADADLALGLTRARESFGLAADSLRATKHKVLTLTVDPEVGQFADQADADYLLFARGASFGSSTGASARDAVVAVASLLLFGGAGISQQKGIVLELALVNANTAEVVWYNRNKPGQTSFDPLDVDSIERLCTALLKPLAGPKRS